jgi:hypothetical protein
MRKLNHFLLYYRRDDKDWGAYGLWSRARLVYFTDLQQADAGAALTTTVAVAPHRIAMTARNIRSMRVTRASLWDLDNFGGY